MGYYYKLAWPSTPDLASVSVTGNFDNWSLSEAGKLSKTTDSQNYEVIVRVDKKQKLVFKFVVNGSDWTTDEAYKVEYDEYGNKNNFVGAEELILEHEDDASAEDKDSNPAATSTLVKQPSGQESVHDEKESTSLLNTKTEDEHQQKAVDEGTFEKAVTENEVVQGDKNLSDESTVAPIGTAHGQDAAREETTQTEHANQERVVSIADKSKQEAEPLEVPIVVKPVTISHEDSVTADEGVSRKETTNTVVGDKEDSQKEVIPSAEDVVASEDVGATNVDIATHAAVLQQTSVHDELPEEEELPKVEHIDVPVRVSSNEIASHDSKVLDEEAAEVHWKPSIEDESSRQEEPLGKHSAPISSKVSGDEPEVNEAEASDEIAHIVPAMASTDKTHEDVVEDEEAEDLSVEHTQEKTSASTAVLESAGLPEDSSLVNSVFSGRPTATESLSDHVSGQCSEREFSSSPLTPSDSPDAPASEPETNSSQELEHPQIMSESSDAEGDDSGERQHANQSFYDHGADLENLSLAESSFTEVSFVTSNSQHAFQDLGEGSSEEEQLRSTTMPGGFHDYSASTEHDESADSSNFDTLEDEHISTISSNSEYKSDEEIDSIGESIPVDEPGTPVPHTGVFAKIRSLFRF